MIFSALGLTCVHDRFCHISFKRRLRCRDLGRDAMSLRLTENLGAHVGIHCFRHGVTTELLESGTPIHIVTRLMRHGDSKVTLDHYAQVVGAAERAASERLSQKIGLQLEPFQPLTRLEYL